MNNFTKENIHEFNEACLAALKSLAAKYDVEIRSGGSRYSATTNDIKFTAAVNGESGKADSKYRVNFNRRAVLWGFLSSDLNLTFNFAGHQRAIEGLTSTKSNAKVVLKRVSDGTLTASPMDQLLSHLELNVRQQKAA